MKNVPRIYLGNNIIEVGTRVPASKDIMHYIKHVMRRNDFLVFGSGKEYMANLSEDNFIIIGEKTEHKDSSNEITLMFSPIKRTDDLVNMATQLGVKAFQPVITERTVAQHINWERMRKIAIEAAEQSGRNSVPEFLPEKHFEDVDLSNVVFADERAAYGADLPTKMNGVKFVFIGPEGGFSEKEFIAFDTVGAKGISLGKTILRAELAAAIAISRVLL